MRRLNTDWIVNSLMILLVLIGLYYFIPKNLFHSTRNKPVVENIIIDTVKASPETAKIEHSEFDVCKKMVDSIAEVDRLKKAFY